MALHPNIHGPEAGLSGRERSRLARARANGYLNATGGSPAAIVRAHGFWCWKLRVPLLWSERKSRYSKYGRLRLDLFTTASMLSPRGQAELAGIAGKLALSCRAVVSPYDGVWEDIPLRRIEELARSVFRAATRLGNYELRHSSSHDALRRIPAADNVLPWRLSA